MKDIELLLHGSYPLKLMKDRAGCLLEKGYLGRINSVYITFKES